MFSKGHDQISRCTQVAVYKNLNVRCDDKRETCSFVKFLHVGSIFHVTTFRNDVFYDTESVEYKIGIDLTINALLP